MGSSSSSCEIENLLVPSILILEEYARGNSNALNLAIAFFTGLVLVGLSEYIMFAIILTGKNKSSITMFGLWFLWLITSDIVDNAIIRFYHKLPVMFNPLNLSAYPDPITVSVILIVGSLLFGLWWR